MIKGPRWFILIRRDEVQYETEFVEHNKHSEYLSRSLEDDLSSFGKVDDVYVALLQRLPDCALGQLLIKGLGRKTSSALKIPLADGSDLRFKCFH